MQLSIAGLVLCVVQRPYRILNVGPLVWSGKMSYSLYLWQQLFAFGEHPRAWYFPFLAVWVAAASYYLLEQPIIRLRELSGGRRKERVLATAA